MLAPIISYSVTSIGMVSSSEECGHSRKVLTQGTFPLKYWSTWLELQCNTCPTKPLSHGDIICILPRNNGKPHKRLNAHFQLYTSFISKVLFYKSKFNLSRSCIASLSKFWTNRQTDRVEYRVALQLKIRLPLY